MAKETETDVVSQGVEAVNERRKAFIELSRLQRVMRRAIETRRKKDSSLKRIEDETGIPWSRLRDFLEGKRSLSGNLSHLDELIVYARGATLPTHEAKLLGCAREIFNTAKMIDREGALVLREEVILNLVFDVYETKARLAPNERAWVYAKAFDTDADVVLGLFEFRPEALTALERTVPPSEGSKRSTVEISDVGQRIMQVLVLDDEDFKKVLARVDEAERANYNVIADALKVLVARLQPQYRSFRALCAKAGVIECSLRSAIARDFRLISFEKAKDVLTKMEAFAQACGVEVRVAEEPNVLAPPETIEAPAEVLSEAGLLAETPEVPAVEVESEPEPEPEPEPEVVEVTPARVAEVVPVAPLVVATESSPRRERPPVVRDEWATLQSSLNRHWRELRKEFSSVGEFAAKIEVSPKQLGKALSGNRVVTLQEMHDFEECMRIYLEWRAAQTKEVVTLPPAVASVEAPVMVPPPAPLEPTPMPAKGLTAQDLSVQELLGELLLRSLKGEIPKGAPELAQFPLPRMVLENYPIGYLETNLAAIEGLLDNAKGLIEGGIAPTDGIQLRVAQLIGRLITLYGVSSETLQYALLGGEVVTSLTAFATGSDANNTAATRKRGGQKGAK